MICLAQAMESSSPLPTVTFFAFALMLAGLALFVGLLIWGLWNPKSLATCVIGAARLLAVLAMGGGVGLLVWGIVAAAMGEPVPIATPAGIIGTGAGSLTGGIVLLVLSITCGGSCRSQSPIDGPQ